MDRPEGRRCPSRAPMLDPAHPRMPPPASPHLVLFDGDCNFCNGVVLFIIDRDPRERFVFAPLQSAIGQGTLRDAGLADPSFDSMVLVEGERVFVRSAAALRIALRLRGLWPLLGALGLLFPRFLRDAIYGAFARRRYALFGKSDRCRVPTPELRRRFLALF